MVAEEKGQYPILMSGTFELDIEEMKEIEEEKKEGPPSQGEGKTPVQREKDRDRKGFFGKVV